MSLITAAYGKATRRLTPSCPAANSEFRGSKIPIRSERMSRPFRTELRFIEKCQMLTTIKQTKRFRIGPPVTAFFLVSSPMGSNFALASRTMVAQESRVKRGRPGIAEATKLTFYQQF